DDAEAAGNVRLASVLAASALRLCTKGSTRTRASLLAKVARGYRATGDLNKAARVYARVRSIGRRARDFDAMGRGTLGLAVVERERGNFHKANRQFELVLRHAEKSKSRELQVFAHQGMQVVAEHLGDVGLMTRHAWMAYTLSVGSVDRELETLHNVAWAAGVAGLVDEVLAVLTAVLERAPLTPRLRFYYLRSTAKVAATQGKREIVDRVSSDVEALGHKTPYVFEYALALMDLGKAYSVLGDRESAQRPRRLGLALARRYGFTGALHRTTDVSMPSLTRSNSEREMEVDVEEIRRVLRTIAAGVLSADPNPRKQTHTAWRREGA
ncbi:MAG: hypothetical protein ACT4P6_11035, partial [Gemmatimonadaceae bacterium]